MHLHPKTKVFPVDGGAMGAAIGAHDWASTALGAPEQWPAALRNALNLMLNSPESMYLLWGPDLLFFYNDAYRPVLGPREHGALAQPIRILWADAWPAVQATIEKALNGQASRFEDAPITMARFGEPEQTWWSFSFSPIYADDGEVGGVFCFTTETTERVRATAELKASEARLQLAIEAADLGTWDLDLLTDTSVRSLRHDQMFGFTELQASWGVESTEPHVVEADRPLFHEAIERARSTGKLELEIRVRGVDGVERWISSKGRAHYDQAGTPVRMAGVVADISERREAQLRLQEFAATLEQRVEESTRERDRMWSVSRDFLLIIGHDARYKRVNPTWLRDFGYTQEQLVGLSFDALVHPDDHLLVHELFNDLSAGVPLINLNARMRRSDGQYRVMEWVAVAAEDGMYCSGRDITELRETEEALRQSQKMEAVGQLTGGVAHDFNNLLTIIRSSVDFLRRPGLQEERRERYLTAVSDTVDRAAKLTGQLLAFARRQALTPEVFDVDHKVRGVAYMLDTLSGARIRVKTELLGHPCFINADLSQFETALVNMAVNARDAMDEEGVLTLRLTRLGGLPSIRGHAASTQGFVAISVSDTGSGIAPALLGRIFEPFFTTKPIGKGTGLGLSQVFGFAKQSGGNVEVSSELNVGTTFTLFLPEVDDGPRQREPEAAPLLIGGAGQRVLVVEDNIEVGQFCTQILEDLGYTTHWTVNAEDALAALLDANGNFAAVFSDVVMPGMGGIALAEQLRRDQPDLPVLLTSGYSHVLAEDSGHGFELLHKPYSAEQLALRLRKLIRLAPPKPRPAG
ncbi:PAS domain S-box protein [Pseudomonas sp. nanlin1]|uniref:PAS domain S-box protein n=1 Tax=Pseudomonas sp. nanlin1 TaxID=3040605 RepID=UPI00388F6E6C